MILNAMPDDRELALASLDEIVDHVRGSPAGRLIIEYGDYECPYSRQAFHAIEQVGRQLGGNVRFAFRHFPLPPGPPGQPSPAWAGDLTAEHHDLMAEHHDLRILRRLAAAQQHQPPEDPDHDQVEQAKGHKPRSCRN